jgi:RNA polymerase sigma-70 factor (ECF subfamily)
MGVQATQIDEMADVINRAKRGDATAFDWLVDAYSARLYGFIYRLLGQREDAEEMVQEVFIRIVRGIGRYEHDGKFEAWLFRIAANLVRDRVRRAVRSPISRNLADNDTDAQDATVQEIEDTHAIGPDESMSVSEEADRLQVALNELGEAEREVVMLRHYSQLSFADIADIMGTPLGTALARGHRGLAKLRGIMESQDC